MPHLLITYRDLTLFDGEVDEFTMADSAQGISVVGKITPARSPSANPLLELLGRRRTPEPEPDTEETA